MLREFEQAIIDRIKSEVPEFLTVKGYEGDFVKETYEEILGLMPCALVSYEASDFERVNKFQPRIMRWTIIIGVESFEKDEARQRVYELLEKTKAALDSVRFNSFRMSPLAIKRERLIYRDAQIVVFGQVYETNIVEET